MSFCRFCGTQLADGQICSCPEAQAEAAKAQEALAQAAAQAQAEEAARQAAAQAQAEEAARQAAAEEAARQAAAQAQAEEAARQAAAEEAARQAAAQAAAEEAARQAAAQAAAEEAARQAAAQAQAAAAAQAQAQAQAGYQQQYYQQAPQGYQQPYYQQAPQGYQQPYYQQAPQGYQQPYYQQAPQGYQQPYYQAPVQPRKPVPGVGPFAQGMKNLLNALKNPGKGIGEYVVSDSLFASLIAIGAQSVLSAFIALFIVGKINNLLGLVSGFGNMFGRGNYSYSISGAGPFFLTILYSMIMSALFALLVFAVAKIFKEDKINIIRCINAAAVKALFASPFIVISYIVFAINPLAGMFVFYLFPLITTVIVLCHVFDECENVKPNMKVIMACIIAIVFILLFIALVAICWKSYIPAQIRQYMGGNINMADIFDRFF